MVSTIDNYTKGKYSKEMPEFSSGDTLSVSFKIKEGEKERIQTFEGVLIGMRNRGHRSTITVRKISNGVGVERIFPLYSPLLENIKVVKKGVVRRSKLYYLRARKGKAARIKEKK